MPKTIRIGGACPIDFSASLSQLLSFGKLDYIIVDFLSEFSIPTLAQRRLSSPDEGFAPAFATRDLTDHLPALLAKKVKMITNAGGLNPAACANAVAKLAQQLGLQPRIAVVLGDDLLDRQAEGGQAEFRDMYSGAALPADTVGMNAYTGALPIARALAMGADIVITGRAVDSALALGPLMYEFGWSEHDYDLLAAGTLIGHLLECGAQATGGIFTDWRDVPDCSNSSFPIAQCSDDGSAIFSIVEGTGGMVSIGTISEQATYEIGDPQRYLMPDVTCDFSNVRLEPAGLNRIRVAGARGYPPTDTYKAVAISYDGWRATVSFVIRGLEASAKAQAIADALIRRTERRLHDRNLGPLRASHIELIGTEASFGDPRRQASREVVCRMVLDHENREAIDLFLRWQRAISISMAPGIATVPLGSTASEVFRVHSFLVQKNRVSLSVKVGDQIAPIRIPENGGFRAHQIRPNAVLPIASPAARQINVPLVKLAWARSGDKGDTVNISVIARLAEYVPLIKAALTSEAVASWFSHLSVDQAPPTVHYFELPGLNALNFVLHGVLGGGGSASMRFDPMGKALGQQLLEFPVPVPQELGERLGTGLFAP